MSRAGRLPAADKRRTKAYLATAAARSGAGVAALRRPRDRSALSVNTTATCSRAVKGYVYLSTYFWMKLLILSYNGCKGERCVRP
ncbi:hypothetical protein EVAR_48768_1 [Eumeta japonica]|uniref:Uncharacterized protein n=1 Tax=Eumeta variegata TaxID=151549 RepID=A0A4C1Y0F2_EUMVA|nr:hypothetical protein EVAR_48768_1 [Eumeta japonica]